MMKLPAPIEAQLEAKQFLAMMQHRNGVPESMLVLTVEDARKIIAKALEAKQDWS